MTRLRLKAEHERQLRSRLDQPTHEEPGAAHHRFDAEGILGQLSPAPPRTASRLPPIDRRRDGVIRAVARLGSRHVGRQVDQLPLIIEPAGLARPRCRWWEHISEPEV